MTDGSDVADDIRETYEEYDVAESRVAVIADPENDDAWVGSDRTVAVLR
jgi:hypothetical protein